MSLPNFISKKMKQAYSKMTGGRDLSQDVHRGAEKAENIWNTTVDESKNMGKKVYSEVTGRDLSHDIAHGTEEVENIWGGIKSKSTEYAARGVESLYEFGAENIPDSWKPYIKEKALEYGGMGLMATKYPIGGEFLLLSLMNDKERTQYAKENLHCRVLSAKQTSEMYQKMGIAEHDMIRYEDKNIKTFVYPKDSDVSAKLNNNRLLQETVKKWYNKPESEREQVALYQTHESGDRDLFLALGRTKLIGLHEIEGGYVEGYVEDVYDFDPEYGGKGGGSRLESFATDVAVKWAVDLQNRGKIQNYRSMIPIRVKVK